MRVSCKSRKATPLPSRPLFSDVKWTFASGIPISSKPALQISLMTHASTLPRRAWCERHAPRVVRLMKCMS
eukprot:7926235-Pyramimonas_sp.AAC.1